MAKQKISRAKKKSSRGGSNPDTHGQKGLIKRMLEIADAGLEGVKQPGRKKSRARKG